MNKRNTLNGKQEKQRESINVNADPTTADDTSVTPVAKKSEIFRDIDQSLNVEVMKIAALKDIMRLGEYSDRKVLIPLNQPIEGVALNPASTK